MKNTCPKCDTAYNVTAAAVGRKFTCKNCSTPLVVTADGLNYQNPPAAAATPAAAPVGGGAAFDFDAGGGAADDDRPAARSAKPAKRRPRDEEDYDDQDDLDSLPQRKPKRGGGKNKVADFLFFREFIAPVVVKLIFWIGTLIVVCGGLVAAATLAADGKPQSMALAAAVVVVGIPVYLLLLRVYCELVLLGFAAYDRLGEIKTLLETRDLR